MLSNRFSQLNRLFAILIFSLFLASCGEGDGPSPVAAESCPANGVVSFDSDTYPESATFAAITVTDACIGRKAVVINVDNGTDTISVDLEVVDQTGNSSIKFGDTDDTSDTIAIVEGGVLTVKYADANGATRSDTADITESTALSTLGVYSETNNNPILGLAEIVNNDATTDRFSQTVAALEGNFSLEADYALPAGGNTNGFAFSFFGLDNPTFEADEASAGNIEGSSGWTTFEFAFTNNTAGPGFGPVSHDAGGSQSLTMFGPFTFDSATGAYQPDNNVVAGQSYTATAHVMNWAPDPLATNNLGIMQLTFWDAAGGQAGGGAQIGPASELLVDSTDDGTNIYIPPQDGAEISDWTELQITQAAPAGAVSAEIFLLHIQLNSDPLLQAGSIFWDDVSLAGVKDLSNSGEDVSTYEALKFGINTTAASGLMDLEIKMEDNTGATASVFLSNYTSLVVGDWAILEIPLSDFTGINKSRMVSLGFNNASSTVTGSTAVLPTLLATTLFFDDVHFAKADSALTGVLLDSPVEGVTFQTATQLGITNVGGEFLYLDGEMVTFSIGDIILGTVPGAPVVTPVELTGSVDPAVQAATNQLVFLQSIDADENPLNGITISTATQATAVGQSLDFTLDSAAFTTAVTSVVGVIAPGNTVVNEMTALDNFYQTYIDLGGTDTFSWLFPGYPPVPAVVSGANTTIDAAPASIEADGITISTITVQAKDTDGNNFTESAGAVVLSSNGSATLSAVNDNDDGTYTATVTNTVVEEVTITGTIAGLVITDNAVVTFTVSGVLETLGVYSETHTSPVLAYSKITNAADFGGNATVPDENSTTVTPLDGTVSLEADFQDSGQTYGGIIFDFSLPGGGGINLLTNSGFESPDASAGDVYCSTGWTCFNPGNFTNNTTGPGFGPVSHETPGSQSLKQYGVDGGAYQEVAVTPGETYTASAWAMNWQGDPLNNLGILQLTFRDAGGNQIGSAFENFVDSVDDGTNIYLPVQDGADISDWIEVTASGVAPAGAVSARLLLLHVLIPPAPGSGTVRWDDASITAAGSATPGGDVSAYETLKFGIDTSSIATFADLKIQLEDGVATPGVFLSDYMPTVSANWQVYEIPLSDFTGLNKANLTFLGFWNASSVAGAETPLVFGPLYFDDIHFVKGIPVEPVLNGVLLDAPVEGVTFQSATQSGITNSLGEFQYQAGEMVTFSIGGIILGTVEGAAIITPVELTGSFDPTDQVATNLLVFLQSIDEDEIHGNGISISAATQAAAIGQTLGFNLDSAAFTTAVTSVVGVISPGNTVVSETTALDDFYQTYVDLGGTNTFTWLYPGYPQVGEPGYDLIWSDEFNVGVSPSATNWTMETGYGDNGWGNNEWQLYTTSPDNVKLESGNLVITADCPTAPACGVRDDTVTSARINTLGSFSFKYGKVKARIKPPVGTGAWPAFWMLGKNFPDVGWPFSGEIDVMEIHNAFSNEFTTHFTLHWCDETKQNPATPDICFPGSEGWTFDSQFRTFGESLGNNFHIFEAEWNAGQMIGKIDGITYYTRTIDPANMDEFLKEFFMILNVAMGGTLGSNNQPPSGSETWPQTMLVDYVRVYQLTGGDGTFTIGDGVSMGLNLLTNGGFELPDASGGDIYCSTDWTCFNPGNFTNNTAGPGFGPVSHETPGSQSLKQYGVDGGAYQEVAVTPGETYTASAWAMNWQGDPLNNLGILQLTFRDAGGNQIGSAFENFVDSVDDGTNIYLPVQDGADISDWIEVTASGVAPAGAVSARLLLLHVLIPPAPGSGTVRWDDASITSPVAAAANTIGLFSETSTSPVLSYSQIINAAVWGGNTTIPNETSTGVTPLDGSVVLQALFLNSSQTFGGIIFDIDAGQDISAYTTLKFGIDTSGIASFADIKLQLEDGVVNPGVFLSSYTPTVSGNWEVYEIPLSDFTGVDLASLTYLGFWNASSVAGAETPLVFGPLYFDDIHFLK